MLAAPRAAPCSSLVRYALRTLRSSVLRLLRRRSVLAAALAAILRDNYA
jgi:hypothetical protein